MTADTKTGLHLARCRNAFLSIFAGCCVVYILVYSITVRNAPERKPTPNSFTHHLLQSPRRTVNISLTHYELQSQIRTANIRRHTNSTTTIHILTTMCGNIQGRIEEAVTMIKSAVVTNALDSNNSLQFHIFSTENARAPMQEMIEKWPIDVRESFSYRFIDTYFPEPYFKNMFRTCSTQRLFMAERVTDLEKAIYLDTDVVVLGSLLPLWNSFSNFTNQTLLGMADETLSNTLYYKMHPTYPHPKPFGVNAGTLMMHLANIRVANWTSELKHIAMTQKAENRNIVGDQDHLNEYMVNHPYALYKMPCIYNYRIDFCKNYEKDQCELANTEGIAALHGNRLVFHQDKYTFRDVYVIIQKYDFKEDPITGILDPIKATLEKKKTSKCYSTRTNLYRNLERTLERFSTIT